MPQRDARPLLLFYAGWNYDTRMALVRRFSSDTDMLVREKVPHGAAAPTTRGCSLHHTGLQPPCPCVSRCRRPNTGLHHSFCIA